MKINSYVAPKARILAFSLDESTCLLSMSDPARHENWTEETLDFDDTPVAKSNAKNYWAE